MSPMQHDGRKNSERHRLPLMSSQRQRNMVDRSFEVVGLGQCCLDYVAEVDGYPPPDSKHEFTHMAVQGGGPVATALAALSRWGVRCHFMGVLGDDLFAGMIRDSLREEGIDTSGVRVRKGCGSQFAFIAAEPGVGRRTVFWRRPTGPPLSPEEIDYGLLAGAEVFHTDGLFAEASIAAARRAKAAGTKVVVDAGTLRDGMLELARCSDYFLASAAFSRALVGGDKPLLACEKLLALGPSLVGITRGAEGYTAVSGGKIIERPAYPVRAVDTTGCGDIFHAGFIYGVIQGWEDEESLEFAAWAASRVSLRLGGRDGIPPLSQWSRGKR
ncbi:MAG: PfkB family carbohydrate kinase [Candidatus Latescibacterota bacterium]